MRDTPTLAWVIFSFLLIALQAQGQSPSLFMTAHDFETRKAIADREPWAKSSFAALIQEADSFPLSYEKRFGLSNSTPPPQGGQWLHWYVCPDSGNPLRFVPPDKNVCPDTGRSFNGYPYNQVVYQLRNDYLAEAAVALGLAFQVTGRKQYADNAASILNDYARLYPGYALHDNYGKQSPNGARAYSQTLDESIWLIKMAWAYDLIRGSGALNPQERATFEGDVLRASAATVSKAHKEPTYNIQSWINTAIAAVGYTLGDAALVDEAIDGPIGFRHQMHTFVHEGFWEEGAWGYQFYAMRPLTMLAQMAAAHGTDLWTQEPNLIALFHSPLAVMLPDGRMPAFNDSGSPLLYEQDFLFEVAYAATRDPSLLNVLKHSARVDREAFLFGLETLPSGPPSQLSSTVYPEAGYAALRSTRNDQTVIMKFGSHGGAHGHFDKLNFVLFAGGMTLGMDPGTYPYGLPIHREWDSMTIAHNTITVDEQRQFPSTGRLLAWRTGPDWSAVTADAGQAYENAALKRTILLTAEYVLVVDHCDSTDHKMHTCDWAFHTPGASAAVASTSLAPFHFTSQTNGYEHISDTSRSVTSQNIDVRFVTIQKASSAAKEESNSTPPTYRSVPETATANQTQRSPVELDLQMVSAPHTELIEGKAPARSAPPHAVVIVRRAGTQVSFVTLFQTFVRASAPSQKFSIDTAEDGIVIIKGPHFLDHFSEEPLSLERRTPQ